MLCCQALVIFPYIIENCANTVCAVKLRGTSVVCSNVQHNNSKIYSKEFVPEGPFVSVHKYFISLSAQQSVKFFTYLFQLLTTVSMSSTCCLIIRVVLSPIIADISKCEMFLAIIGTGKVLSLIVQNFCFFACHF